MQDARRSRALPGLPVTLVPVAAVEPGDLLLGPDLGQPTRVWWRWDSPTGLSTIVWAGSRHTTPATTTVPGTDWVPAAGRGMLLDPQERRTRLLCALRGGLWLSEEGHEMAPDRGTLRTLLDAYARLADLSPRDAAAHVRDGLPEQVRPPAP